MSVSRFSPLLFLQDLVRCQKGFTPPPDAPGQHASKGTGMRMPGLVTQCIAAPNSQYRDFVSHLNLYLKGWWNYYRLTEARNIFKSLNGWIFRRLRCVLWTQWKYPGTKVRNLLKRGISLNHAVSCGNARKKMWRMSKVKWVIIALPNKYFLDHGLFLPGN